MSSTYLEVGYIQSNLFKYCIFFGGISQMCKSQRYECMAKTLLLNQNLLSDVTILLLCDRNPFIVTIILRFDERTIMVKMVLQEFDKDLVMVRMI